MTCHAKRQNDEMFCAICGYRWEVSDPEPPACRTTKRNPVAIIGLSGRAGSGKSTAAAYMEATHGYIRARFAGPLKDALRRMLRDAVVDDHTVERMIEGDLKEVPCALLLGKTPRQAMQTLGTEWGRHCIGDTFWVNLMRHRLEQLRNGLVVIEDVRFQNEADMIRSMGGKVVCITGRGGITGSHPSEAGVDPDMTCYNDGLMSDMYAWLDHHIIRGP
jgi:hypothetical protein